MNNKEEILAVLEMLKTATGELDHIIESIDGTVIDETSFRVGFESMIDTIRGSLNGDMKFLEATGEETDNYLLSVHEFVTRLANDVSYFVSEEIHRYDPSIDAYSHRSGAKCAAFRIGSMIINLIGQSKEEK